VITKIEDIIRSYGGRIVSMLSSYEGDTNGLRKIYIRARNLNHLELEQLKKEIQRKAVLLYMVDHRENKREVYYH
jgi:acetoin utilization protein AcuB